MDSNRISNLLASHAFIEVVVHIDSNRVARNGTFIRVAIDLSCRDVLAEFLSTHAPNYSTLPGNGKVVLLCSKISDNVQRRSAADVGVDKDCSSFLDFPLTVPLAEVPTKRFTFKCFQPRPSVAPPLPEVDEG